MNCCVFISLTPEDNYLPFLDLGYTAGVTKNYLEDADNTSSVAINIPGGLTVGTDNQTLVHVSKITSRISLTNSFSHIGFHRSVLMATSPLEEMHNCITLFSSQSLRLTISLLHPTGLISTCTSPQKFHMKFMILPQSFLAL